MRRLTLVRRQRGLPQVTHRSELSGPGEHHRRSGEAAPPFGGELRGGSTVRASHRVGIHIQVRQASAAA